jgi:diguanylate cyclase (GGDEF)-like protein/PAS domain S-box-containing protein
MSDRTELLESVLDSLPDGVALVDVEGKLAFWSHAAEAITGYSGADLVGRPLRDALERLVAGGAREWTIQTDTEVHPGRGSLIRAIHRLGHEFPAMARIIVLRDGFGGRIGTAVVFHPAVGLDTLPHGEGCEAAGVAASQTDLEDRLGAEFEVFARSHLPWGVLWITVDQAHDLRKTHGGRACEAMLEKVEHALANGLRVSEEIGRWGDDEFLVISHERTPEMLAAHAQDLAGLARTADFRWWGDRISLTVSIGAAQADESGTLAGLLEQAQAAMRASTRAGGNHVTHLPGGHSCLPS